MTEAQVSVVLKLAQLYENGRYGKTEWHAVMEEAQSLGIRQIDLIRAILFFIGLAPADLVQKWLREIDLGQWKASRWEKAGADGLGQLSHEVRTSISIAIDKTEKITGGFYGEPTEDMREAVQDVVQHLYHIFRAIEKYEKKGKRLRGRRSERSVMTEKTSAPTGF